MEVMQLVWTYMYISIWPPYSYYALPILCDRILRSLINQCWHQRHLSFDQVGDLDVMETRSHGQCEPLH